MTDDIISLLREIQRDAVLMWDESQTIDQAVDEIERLRQDRNRWRQLAKYVCANASSIAIPDSIAKLFPDPLPADYQESD